MHTPTLAPSPTPIPTIAYTPTFERAACEFYPPPGTNPECGFLSVPEDRRQPGSATLGLHVAIFRATGSNPAPDPLIHLSGGPGSASLDLAWYHFQQGEGRFLESRDFILFDQRGTGHSQPSLACPEADDQVPAILGQDLSIEEINALEMQAMEACRQRLAAQGINLAAYNSAASAADVEDLRIALGYDQINLYGVSYGTRLALTVMRDYPQHLRAVILDSAYPPQVNLYTGWPANAERAFDALFAACADDAACAGSYPDLEARFYRLVDALEAAPATVPVANPTTSAEVGVVLDGDLLVDVVFSGLYRPDITAQVPRLIADVERGYYSQFLQGRLGRYFDRSTSRGMQASVQCGEEIPFSPYEELVAAAQGVQPQIAHNYTLELASLYTICETWGAGTPDPRENEPVTGDVPTLILAGSFDPITPPAWGQLAAQTLAQWHYVEFPNSGHWVMRTGNCPLDVATAFLNDPAVAPDTSCVQTLGPPTFAP
jgi:pimeloyl-ACP methyl ester carboxylesterase